MGQLIKLGERAGINLNFDTQKSKLSAGHQQYSFSQRTFGQLKDVVLEKNAFQDNEEMYLMFRKVHRLEDQETFEKAGLRYDVTVIPPKLIGKQFVLTYGHYHEKMPNSDLTFREIYEVLHGNAIFFFQKGFDRIDNAIAIHASEGQKVIIESGFGHLTINPSNSFLILANIVSDKFESDYNPIKEKKGGCYYFTFEDGKIVAKKNPNYSFVAPLQNARAIEIRGYSGPIYTTFISNPEKFRFLSEP